MRAAFSNVKALIEFLDSDKFNVSRFRASRTNTQCEYWTLKNFLLKIRHIWPVGPVGFLDRESPDFHLVLNEVSIGIEVTEIIPSAVAQGLSQLEKRGKSDIFNLNALWRHQRPLQRGDNIDSLTSFSKSAPFYGSAPEKIAAQEISASIRKKVEKMENGTYERYDLNIYLGYLSNPPVPLNSLILKRILKKSDLSFEPFDCVIILTDGKFMRLHK